MVYHLLPGNESFSASSGLAIAHDVANIMRHDGSAIVVCRDSDGSWGFAKNRHIVIARMRIFGRMRGRKYVPRWITSPFFRQVFRPLLLRLKPGDIVWCHNQPFFCAALASGIRAKGAMLIYHAHNPLTDRPTRAAFKAFSPDACIFVSDAIRERALQWIPWLHNTHVIHNGADDSVFYPAPPQCRPRNVVPVVLFVGRLVPIKGAHVLIDAMRILHGRRVKLLCRMIGSSFLEGSTVTPYVSSLHDRRPPNVEFKGFCPHTEIAHQYRAADMLCCPSVWQEPFGNVNIEAMACGIPVIATRVGGIPEIAAEGGIALVEPNSAVDLADALQKFAEDENLRTQVGSAGLRAFQRRFTWAAICRQYQAVTDDLAGLRSEEVARPWQQRLQA
jgi:spore coat protein SA